MPSNAPAPIGPGPAATRPPRQDRAVAYVCAEPDPVSVAMFTAWCEQRAAGDGWTVVETVVDPDDLVPLAERPGWQRVTQLVTEGQVGVVVTINRRMVANCATAWARLSDLLQGLGVVLTISGARTCPPPGQPR
ncbi:hypothetical protein ACIHEI_34135 [Kitasatospora sp. NPDC051984]|uniref:hypothetical protein n=1 Tax=Kitasatospora sp. NPDC051984 TaxID=3364059 RepID=UPI0037C5F5E0